MPVLVVRLDPWLAAQTFLGEAVPERWRRLGAAAGFDVQVATPDEPVPGAAVVSGHGRTLGVDELRSVAEGLALVLEEPDAVEEERTEVGDDRTVPRIRRTPTAPEHGLVVAAPGTRAFLVGTTDAVGPTRGLVLWWNQPVRDLPTLVQREQVGMRAILRALLDRGVRLVGEGQFVAPSVHLEAGCTIGPQVVLLGRTRVGAGAVVQLGGHLADTEVGAGAWVKPYVVAEGAVIGPGAQVGPFAHLREGTELGADVRIGNFVETKKAVLGAGAKANHLAYLGDVTVGARSNLGAGTITCNYDGARKHHTEIGADVFVGTNASLVAPVTLGDGALIAAGSVVTEDVPPGALAVARGVQHTVPGKGRAILERNRKAKASGA